MRRAITQGGNIMTRRTIIMLTGMTLLGLAFAASPQVALAQSDPFDGIWQLNLAKSNLTGPLAGTKSITRYDRGEGQNRRMTLVGIDAQGNPLSAVYMHIYDGQPHPTTGSTSSDASAMTRVGAHHQRQPYEGREASPDRDHRSIAGWQDTHPHRKRH
jgi:hypothetical protein